MTELSLIFGITLASLTFSGGLLRWISGLALGGAEQARIYNAVARASEAYFWRVMRASLPTVSVVVPLLAVAMWIESHGANGGGVTILWGLGGWLVGFLLTNCLAFLTIQVSVRVASRAVEAAREDASHAMVVLLRGTGVCSLLADTLSIATVAGVVAFRAASLHGVEAPSLELLRNAVSALPSLGLGAAISALLLHSAGSTFHSASDVASLAARDSSADSTVDDERNPALIAALVGDHVGVVISRTVDAFLVGILANIAAVIASFAVLSRNPTVFQDPLLVLALPLLLRAVGLVGTAFGMMAARAEESQDPIAATWRGLLTTITVTLSGLAGSCLWVLGRQRWASVFLASAVGLLACSIAAQLPSLLARWTSPHSDAEQREGWRIGKDLGIALQVALIPVLFFALSMTTAHAFGEYTSLTGGGILGLIVALCGMCSIGAYMSALNVVGPLAANVKSVALLPLGQLPPEAQRRAARIDGAASSTASVAQTFFIFSGVNAALLAGISLLLLNPVDTMRAIVTPISFDAPAVLWSGVLGSAIVLGYVGSAIAASSAGSLVTLREVKKQLSAARGSDESTATNFTPNYRSAIEIATGSSLERVTVLALAAVFVPATVGLCLRVYYGANAQLTAEAMLAFVILASVTALAIGLIAHAARSVVERLRTASPGTTRSQPLLLTSPSALQFGAIAELLGNSAGLAAQIFVKALAIVCLTLTPLII